MGSAAEQFVLKQNRSISYIFGGCWLIMGIAFAFYDKHLALQDLILIMAGVSLLSIAYLFPQQNGFLR
jgi:hypothetical protein